MSNISYAAIIASILACTVTSIGIYVINRYKKWGKKYMVYFMCFAAGVLVTVSFTHIIPKSFEMAASAPLFLLGGYFFFHIVDKFLNMYVCTKDTKECKIGITPTLGVGFHSLVDGIIYSVTFTVSMLTGTLAAIGMVLHEFPEGIIVYLLLIRSGFEKKKAFFYAFLAAGLTTPIGALISYPFINVLKEPALGILLSISAGALVYVGASHLLPETTKYEKTYSLIALGVGILVALGIVLTH